MAGFKDLPNEILFELWRYMSTPSDIVNLAVVSKAVNGIGAKSLSEHRRLQYQYSVIDNRIKGCGSLLARVLRDVLVNPNVGLYVKTLRVSGWTLAWDSEEEGSSDIQDTASDAIGPLVWHSSNRKDDVSRFTKALMQTEDKVRYSFAITEWVGMLEDGDEDPLVVLLLLFLPNFTRFHVRELTRDTWIVDIFHEIAKSPAAGLLCYLTDVELTHLENVNFEHMSLIKHFALIPSVRRITCRRLIDEGYQRGNFDCYMPPQSSNVRELFFEGGGKIVEGLRHLLSGFSTLRSFTYRSPIYEDPESEAGCDQPFDAELMCNSLFFNAKHSLEYLSIDGQSQKIGSSARRSSYMGTLISFNALRIVNTAYDLLVDRNGDENELDILDALPSSVEEINLRVCQDDRANPIRLFTNSVLRVRYTCLMRLRKLTFNTDGENTTGIDISLVEFPELQKACQVIGIDFKVQVPRINADFHAEP